LKKLQEAFKKGFGFLLGFQALKGLLLGFKKGFGFSA